MTERTFLILLGATLLVFLFNQWDIMIYGYIGLLLFEGITNYRIPFLVSRIRYGNGYKQTNFPDIQLIESKFNFEAERALRFVIAGFLILTFVLFNETVWFFPWFIGFMLSLAGITNICLMTLSLRWLGFK